MGNLTAAQSEAVQAEGNILVVAGAGAGKTRTLVERCLDRLLRTTEPSGLDRMLVVTFTEAAAAEVRHRIRSRLLEETERNAGQTWLEEQLALLDTAHICTLHSFCLRLIREHFHELEIDPQFMVLSDTQARVLIEECLDEILDRHYAGATPNAGAVLTLIEALGGGGDGPVRDLILKLHHYTQTLPDPRAWFQAEAARYRAILPAEWRRWLFEGFVDWRDAWLPTLDEAPPENSTIQRCAAALHRTIESLPVAQPEALPSGALPTGFAEIESALIEIIESDQVWPNRRKTVYREPFKKFFEETAFLHSLVASPDSVEKTGRPSGESSETIPVALVEDWNWVRPQMETLLALAVEFSDAFARAKREQAAADFHDLEQFALRLLWDSKADRPTPLASEWRDKFRYLFVDEYQDINAAQDAILRALGGSGPTANRFLVGDVKQSIYRFRLANPRIFQRYKADWERASGQGRIVNLAENFRSHQALLGFVNELFAELLGREIGGVVYDEAARLRFGDPVGRRELTVQGETEQAARADPSEAAERAGPVPSKRVEVHLLLASGTPATESEENGPTGDDGSAAEAAVSTTTEREARLIAERLRRLQEERFPVWDQDAKCRRPVEWRDMAILLRGPSGRAEAYAKEFAQAGVPLQANRSGFYESTEISDLLSLLMLLDNPLQDIPLLAVLRSPLVGLSLDELAEIRLAAPRDAYWTALRRFHRNSNPSSTTADEPSQKPTAGPLAGARTALAKVDLFLERFERWRRMARETSLSQRLEAVLSETLYFEWLLSQPRGPQRQANVRRLLALALEFDPLQRQGLQRFLRFVDAQREAGPETELAGLESDDTVRLTSIHRSKGLEFPVVVLADLAAKFNLRDLNSVVLLDEQFGLCPKVISPRNPRPYPSLPFWLARQRQRAETIGEELRLLYVALTRARDLLLLVGTATEKAALETWPTASERSPSVRQLLEAGRLLDWFGPWWTRSSQPDWAAQPTGEAELFRWFIHSEETSSRIAERRESSLAETIAKQPLEHPQPAPVETAALEKRLTWRYPFPRATVEPAKTSVSMLRHRPDETDDESATWFVPPVPLRPRPSQEIQPARRVTPSAAERGTRLRSGLSAAEVGNVYHHFLERLDLDCAADQSGLNSEATRLESSGLLTEIERRHLNLENVLRFWQSPTGRRVLDHRDRVHRELPFTARFSLTELAEAGLGPPNAQDSSDFVVVQGVIDLAVLLAEEIWILDFKTDRLRAGELEGKTAQYQPQLRIYSKALAAIYRRPVTQCWLHFLSLDQTIEVA